MKLCAQCGRVPPRPRIRRSGSAPELCEACRSENILARRARYWKEGRVKLRAARNAAGQCYQCTAPLSPRSKQKCADCLDDELSRKRARREAKAEARP